SCQALLFDLDGTLVDSAQDLYRSLNHVLETYSFPILTLDQVRHLIGHGARQLIARGFWGEEALAPEPGKDERFEAAVGLFLDYYRHHLTDFTRPFDGVVETLQELSRRKFRLGVVTNKPEHLTHPLLAGLGLDQYFQVVVGGDTLPQRKPDAAPLHHAFATLKANSGVMVGDSETDVQAARAAGCPVIVVPYGYHRGLGVDQLQADYQVAHFKDILELVTLYR
ncbi:MAG: phosphoglycolate phosphatase, partial [Magnetococcales bacterium]|nr:phosphoglycolate phosphatase [Magnetococcales bacterium]